FEVIEPYVSSDMTIERAGATPRVAHTASIMPDFLRFAGQRPIVGRAFTEDEARTNASVVMVSEGMWRNQYGADPAVIGKVLTVNNKLFTIIGVMPGVFQLPRASDSDMDLWLPLDLATREDE